MVSPTKSTQGGGLIIGGKDITRYVVFGGAGLLIVLLAGGVVIRRRKKSSGGAAAGMRPSAAHKIRVGPDDVAQLVGAFRSIYTVNPEVLRALELALPAVAQPLRGVLQEELAAYFRAERTRVFDGLPESMDKNGYLQQFVAIISSPDASRETLLEALKQLEERLARK